VCCERRTRNPRLYRARGRDTVPARAADGGAHRKAASGTYGSVTLIAPERDLLADPLNSAHPVKKARSPPPASVHGGARALPVALLPAPRPRRPPTRCTTSVWAAGRWTTRSASRFHSRRCAPCPALPCRARAPSGKRLVHFPGRRFSERRGARQLLVCLCSGWVMFLEGINGMSVRLISQQPWSPCDAPAVSAGQHEAFPLNKPRGVGPRGELLLQGDAQALARDDHERVVHYVAAPSPPSLLCKPDAHLSPTPYKPDAHLSPTPYRPDAHLSRVLSRQGAPVDVQADLWLRVGRVPALWVPPQAVHVPRGLLRVRAPPQGSQPVPRGSARRVPSFS
jgi:hypothetical protein